MEGIFNILKAEGIELTDEVKKKINKSLSSEYKSIAEYSNLKKKIEDLNCQIQDQTKISEEMEALKSKNNEISKLYEESINNQYKLQALKSGINDKFVDFVTSDVLKNKKDNEEFNTVLDKYIKDNPQYLTTNTNFHISTTPQSKNKTELKSSNDLINNLIRGIY